MNKLSYKAPLLIFSCFICISCMAQKNTNRWIEQNEKTPIFRFSVSVNTRMPAQDSVFAVVSLKIYNKQTAVIQIIRFTDAKTPTPLENAIHLTDANFDGYPDIVMKFQEEANPKNHIKNYYLYDPHRSTFAYNKALSSLSNLKIDSIHKLLTTYRRQGAGYYEGATYQFKGDRLQKIHAWSRSQMSDGYFTSNKEDTLVKGKWERTEYTSGKILSEVVQVFPENDTKRPPSGRLYRDDPALIKKETALLFYVEATDSRGSRVTGWIKKEAMLPEYWIKCDAATPLYRFEETDSNTVVAIRVVSQKTGTPIQLLTKLRYTASSDIFQTGDYNFDGSADFRIREDDTTHGLAYDYFIYDNEQKLFHRDTVISGLNNVVFDTPNKRVRGDTTDQDGNRYSIIYHYANKKWKAVINR